jgi:hypothetical protein
MWYIVIEYDKDLQNWITAPLVQNIYRVPFYFSVTAFHHFDADSDFSAHLNANPDPSFYFDAAPELDLVLDPVPHQSDANLRPLVYRPSSFLF